MRLGLNWVSIEREDELENALPLIDDLGLGTIGAPGALAEWSEEECAAFGEMVRGYGLTIGEHGYWESLLTRDERERERQIEIVRDRLRKADAMGVDCVVTLAGSFGGDWAGAPHPDNWSEEARGMVVENCRRILDGLDLEHTTYALEPWYNTFFHAPESVRELLDEVDHPDFGVHMDAMNMHSIQDVYRSSALIERAFDLLAEDVAAVHAKDIRWDPSANILSLEEVIPGDGSMDYDLYVRKLDELPEDVPVFTEHWDSDDAYVETMRRLRRYADENGIELIDRHA